jgi:hypothetical protein
MNTTIIAIAVAYILIIGIILRTFSYMRDRNERHLPHTNDIIKPIKKPYSSKKLLT